MGDRARGGLWGQSIQRGDDRGFQPGGQFVAMAAEALNARKSNTVSSIVTLSGAVDFVLKIEDIQDGVVKG